MKGARHTAAGKRGAEPAINQAIIRVEEIETSEYNTVIRNGAGEIYVIGDGHFGQRAIEPSKIYD